MSLLRVTSVSKSFHDKNESLQVLSGVNFNLNPGNLCSICGPSGSGKTTLLNIIAGLDAPDQGEVYLGEERLDNLEETNRARIRTKEFGIVFQSANLVSHLTALENVLLPTLFLKQSETARKSHKDSAQLLLETLHLWDKAKKSPAKLSGGEKRRVSIARALVTKPKLLLADEPTINLDSENRDVVMAIIKDYTREGGAAIVSTHDEVVARSSDSILKIRFGIVSTS